MHDSRLRLRMCTHNQKVGALRRHDLHATRSQINAVTAETDRRYRVAVILAAAFRDGAWEQGLMARRGAHDLRVDPAPWISALADQVLRAFPTPPHDSPRTTADFVANILGQSRFDPEHEVMIWIQTGRVGTWHGPTDAVAVPIAMGERRWPVERLDNAAELARFLGLGVNELEWYSDVRSLERSVQSENLRHYDYSWRVKRSGGVRLIEAPKQNLKSFQRKLLRQIIRHVPVHDAAHGFCPGRSIQSFAGPHVGRAVVIRMDLRSFFMSVPAGRVFGIFRTAGYAEDVAHQLTGLVTNATPSTVLNSPPERSAGGGNDMERGWLRGPHLPQGAPTSPALANLAAHGLDRRLAGLAAAYEANYSRYADDLAFSGGEELAKRPGALLAAVAGIVRDEGFWLNEVKTRVRTQAQRQVLTGMVVNRHLNIHRREYDQLKAVLHDAMRHGPAAANREGHPAFRSHLEGRIGFVQATNPARARKLWRSFDRINW